MSLLSLVALATALSPLALAHPGCGGHGELIHRNLGNDPNYSPSKRQGPSTEQQGAQSTDPTYECTYYNYPLITQLKPYYPVEWTTATIQPNDTEAMDIFNTINSTLNSKLPNDTPHCPNATDCHMGAFTGVDYNSTDPDCWWTWRQCTTPAASTGLPADITVVPEPNTWGLGFDDGPNCSHNAFYDFLQSENQKATLFYIGSNVFDWPLQGLRGIADGHEICVHTWSHQYMTSFSNEEAFAELYYARKIIKDVLGVTPKCWRPPYGDVDNRIRMIAAGLNLTTIVWQHDSQDWREGVPADNVTAADVTQNYMNVINGGLNGTFDTEGTIVLTHELTNFTMSEAMQMLPKIKSAFKYVVPICAAMNWTQPYVETNYTCPNFASYISGNVNTSTSTTNPSSAVSGSSSASGSAASGSASASSSHSAAGRVELGSVWTPAALLAGVLAGSMLLL